MSVVDTLQLGKMLVFSRRGWGSAPSLTCWTDVFPTFPDSFLFFWDISHAGRHSSPPASQTCKALSLECVCTPSFLKTLKTEQWRLGEGGAYLCACNILSTLAGIWKTKRVGWGFSVFRILLFWSKQRITIQMNCVAQNWGKRRWCEQLVSVSFCLVPFAASLGL